MPPIKTKKIDLTHFGVRGENNNDMQPEGNPHTVSETFANELIASGRAVEHDPDNPIKPEPKVEEKAADKGKK